MKNYLKTLGLCLCLGLASQAHALSKNDLISASGGAEMMSPADKVHLIIGKNGNHVLKWSDFNLDRDERAVFSQGNFLNIVKGKKPSSIKGAIEADGNFLLVNPNGITAEVGSSIIARGAIGFSTAKPTDAMIKEFSSRGTLKITHRGMERIRLLDRIEASNLAADGSQIIIRDAQEILAPGDDGPNQHVLKNDPALGQSVHLVSSVNRVDIGGARPEDTAEERLKVDPSSDYTIEGTLFNQQGKTTIGTAEELGRLKDGSGEYWLYDDIEADLSSEENLGTFTGSLDGAFNSISYQGKEALFESVDGAEIANLKLEDVTLTLEGADPKNVGALAGTIKNSKLENIEIKGLNVETAGGPVTAGTLAGRLEGSNSLKNVAGSGLKVTGDAPIVQGSLIGEAAADSKISASGITYGAAEDLKAVGKGDAELASSLTEAIAQAQGRGEDLSEIIIFNEQENASSHAGFLDPYFVEDFDDEYDGTAHSYQGRLDNEYFASHNHITYDNDANGPMINAGEYHFALTTDEHSRYFVKDGEKSAVGDGIYTITKKDLGTIKVDATVKEDGSIEYEITNPDDLNFADGDDLSDLDPSFELTGDLKDEPELTGDSDNPNYNFDTELGGITFEEKYEGEITPPVDPDEGGDNPSVPTDPDEVDEDLPNPPVDPDDGNDDQPDLPADPDNGSGDDDCGNAGGDLPQPQPPHEPGLDESLTQDLRALNAGMVDELAPCDFCKGPDKLLQGNDGARFTSNKKSFLSQNDNMQQLVLNAERGRSKEEEDEKEQLGSAKPQNAEEQRS